MTVTSHRTQCKPRPGRRMGRSPTTHHAGPTSVPTPHCHPRDLGSTATTTHAPNGGVHKRKQRAQAQAACEK